MHADIMQVKTYRGHDVDISIAVQRRRIHEEDWEGSEVARAKPLYARDAQILGETVLQPHQSMLMFRKRVTSVP